MEAFATPQLKAIAHKLGQKRIWKELESKHWSQPEADRALRAPSKLLGSFHRQQDARLNQQSQIGIRGLRDP